MPSINEISQLAQQLHDKKILNLDVSAKDLLASQSGVLNGSDPAIAGWYVLGGDHYVVVCGAKAQAVSDPAILGPQTSQR